MVLSGSMLLPAIGMIAVQNKKILCSAILTFMDALRQDLLYNVLPCFRSSKGSCLQGM